MMVMMITSPQVEMMLNFSSNQPSSHPANQPTNHSAEIFFHHLFASFASCQVLLHPSLRLAGWPCHAMPCHVSEWVSAWMVSSYSHYPQINIKAWQQLQYHKAINFFLFSQPPLLSLIFPQIEHLLPLSSDTLWPEISFPQDHWLLDSVFPHQCLARFCNNLLNACLDHTQKQGWSSCWICKAVVPHQGFLITWQSIRLAAPAQMMSSSEPDICLPPKVTCNHCPFSAAFITKINQELSHEELKEHLSVP